MALGKWARTREEVVSPIVTKFLLISVEEEMFFFIEAKKQRVDEGLVNKIWEADTRNCRARRI